MPGPTNSVGPLSLPLAAGAPDTAIDDPTVTGLLDYFAFWLRTSLNAKLGNLQGTSADAVPVANRFPWDPASYFVRGAQDGAPNPFPALYVWWMGRGTRFPRSTLKTMRQRQLGVMWVFDELTLPGALVDRHGLIAAADAALESAVDLGYHPSYGLNSAPMGTPVAVSLSLSGPGMRYMGAQIGSMSAIPGDSQSVGARPDGHVVRAYPALQAVVEVYEQIRQFQANDPADVGTAILATVRGSTEGAVSDAPTIIQRYLPKPDGTEDFPQS